MSLEFIQNRCFPTQRSDKVISVAWRTEFLFSSSEDRTIRLFPIESFQTDQKHFRITCVGDEPGCLAVSENGQFLIAGMRHHQVLVAYGIHNQKNKETNKIYQLLREYAKTEFGEICSVQLLPDNRHILACSKDTTVTMWDTKGNLLDILQTKQLRYFMASLSPSGNMLAIATSMSDLKLFHANWTGGGANSQGTFSSFDQQPFTQLVGHNSGISYVSWTKDSKRIITSAKDGTWRLWNMDGDFKRGFQPKASVVAANPKGKNHPFNMHALSTDESVLATVSSDEIQFWNLDGSLIGQIEQPSLISDLCWSPTGYQVATAGADGVVRLFNAPK